MEKARPVSLKEIRIRDNFWDKYRRLVREEILKYQWCAMNDQIEGAPKSHCIENFRIAAGEKQGVTLCICLPHSGHLMVTASMNGR